MPCFVSAPELGAARAFCLCSLIGLCMRACPILCLQALYDFVCQAIAPSCVYQAGVALFMCDGKGVASQARFAHLASAWIEHVNPCQGLVVAGTLLVAAVLFLMGLQSNAAWLQWACDSQA